MKHLSILFKFFCETKLSFESRIPLFQKEEMDIYWKFTEIAKFFKNLLFKDQMEIVHNESF